MRVRVGERVSGGGRGGRGGRVVSLGLPLPLPVVPLSPLSLWSATGVLVVLYIGQNRYVPHLPIKLKTHPTPPYGHYEQLRPPLTPSYALSPPTSYARQFTPIHANTPTVLSYGSVYMLQYLLLLLPTALIARYSLMADETTQCQPLLSRLVGWTRTRIASLSFSSIWKSSPEATRGNNSIG